MKKYISVIFFVLFGVVSRTSYAQTLVKPPTWGEIQGSSTNQEEIYTLSAPYVNLITVTNTSAITSTIAWSNTNTYRYVYLSTGAVTLDCTWPVGRIGEIYLDLICTGRPNFIFPSNAVRFVNGTYTNIAASLGTNNTIYFFHSPYRYWYWAISNDLSTGTP